MDLLRHTATFAIKKELLINSYNVKCVQCCKHSGCRISKSPSKSWDLKQLPDFITRLMSSTMKKENDHISVDGSTEVHGLNSPTIEFAIIVEAAASSRKNACHQVLAHHLDDHMSVLL